jgi:hypothetical protein
VEDRVLLLAVLISALAKRTILSTAVLFLATGFVLGPDTTGVLDIRADSSIVGTLAETIASLYAGLNARRDGFGAGSAPPADGDWLSDEVDTYTRISDPHPQVSTPHTGCLTRS